MCEANVYLVKGEESEELVLSDVAFIRVDGEDVLLSTIMGSEKSVRAQIRTMDMVNHKVVLEPIREGRS